MSLVVKSITGTIGPKIDYIDAIASTEGVAMKWHTFHASSNNQERLPTTLGYLRFPSLSNNVEKVTLKGKKLVNNHAKYGVARHQDSSLVCLAGNNRPGGVQGGMFHITVLFSSQPSPLL